MNCEETDNAGVKSIDESGAAVNSAILDYYKKFGRKRDLEQFFSLSSAENEVRDVTSLFWRRMKSHTDSSDSGERKSKSESSTELCRISIKCSLPEPCSSSQDETTKTKSDSVSPPIIIEEIPSKHTDDESANDDNQSQKSIDALLDTSINKPLSPTSSITSQRKLEWDSLADVGYANESDRKTSASSLSTLERLALKQQYSNNDSKENNDMGTPTAHSTLMEVNENKFKGKKGGMRKTTKIYKKDVDVVEVSLPHGTETSPSQAINVNLTKHISFNMEKDGGITLDNIKKDVNVTPENAPQPSATSYVRMDKEIQTTLTKTQEKAISPENPYQSTPQNCCQRVPVLINLNTLRKKYRKKKLMLSRRKLRNKKKVVADKENIPVQEKSTEQVSAAESFEYMPGHVYNQNQMNLEQPRVVNMAGNKSSLESSAAVTTTESSKDSKHSFTKDLEKSIELLKVALRRTHDDSELKNKLIKEVVQRLLKSRYRDDESTTDFLSGLSFSSKKLGLGDFQGTTTTSTSESNNTEVHSNLIRPKKSILRSDKFNPNILPSTSQSAPNLPAVANSEKPIVPNLKHTAHKTHNTTESDMSSGGKNSSGIALGKASSEELYQKYLEALKREEAYKKHLRDKEMFLKQKLVCSETAFKVPQLNVKVNNKLKDVIKDLTRNNYNDGSGDASKLEQGSNSEFDFQRYNANRKQRSHSVFTLSSGNSDEQNRKANLKKKLQSEIKESQAGSNNAHHCCCPHRLAAQKVGLADSSIQVNIDNIDNKVGQQRQVPTMPWGCCGSSRNSPRNVAHVVSDDVTGDIKYVCLCNKPKENSDNMLIYKCSRLTTRGVQLENTESKASNTVGVQCNCSCQCRSNINNDYGQSKERAFSDKSIKIAPSSTSDNGSEIDRMSKTSQTNLALKMLQRKSSERSIVSSSSIEKRTQGSSPRSVNSIDTQNKIIIHEATRSVQTEISINPKISDPSLTDINIINEEDSVQLISERFREVSKRNSEIDIKIKEPMTNDNVKQETVYEHSTKILRSGYNYHGISDNRNNDFAGNAKKVDKEVQSDVELNNNEAQIDMNEPITNDKDNFTIPIQGTNMTLMVRIDPKGDNVVNEKTRGNYITQSVCTDKVIVDDKGTSLTEECSKAVQSPNIDIFSSIDKGLLCSRQMINDEPAVYSQRIKQCYNKNDATTAFSECVSANTCPNKNLVRNTYPKTVLRNPKPFLRSNTDTGRFVSGSYVQTDAVAKDPTMADSEKICEPESDDAKSRYESDKSSKAESIISKQDNSLDAQSQRSSTKSGKDSKKSSEKDASSSKAQSRKSSSDDPILDIIKDITKRYSKTDIDRCKKKKCFKEIVTVLNYLLDTEDGIDNERAKSPIKPSPPDSDKSSSKATKVQETPQAHPSTKVDKAIQLSPKQDKPCKRSTLSSEIRTTTDFPGTSSDSATCKVLNKIKKECEKYHQKRCRSYVNKKCEASSSTSVNCEQCKRVHHCHCRGHRCHKSKSVADKKKKCVAYNLIIQTSDSMFSEETVCDNNVKPLQNIVVKVPKCPKSKQMEKVPFKEVSAKIEKKIRCSPKEDKRTHRSRSCPNESDISSIDEFVKGNCGYTVKDYLEINRPDFMEQTSNRQKSLKAISENRAKERAAHRQLLSAQMDRQPTLTSFSETELRRFAKDLGVHLRTKKLAPKFINEREMKKHSENIYKSLPEVVQKKEEVKKEKIKKTNLLMANIFKKNLQKKTLSGAVNISNYNAVIKI